MICIISILAPLLLVLILKLSEKIFNWVDAKLEQKRHCFRPPKNNKSLTILKYVTEVLVGVTVFNVCFRVLSLPIYFIQGINIPPMVMQLALILILIYAAIITFKTIKFIHKHLVFESPTNNVNE